MAANVTVTRSTGVTTSSYIVTGSIANVTNSTTDSPIDHNIDDKADQSLRFIIVPVCALGIVVVLTIVVILLLRKKRLDRLRHHLMPFYNFDPGEEGEDWEAELLEDNGDFTRPNMKDYKTMEHEFSTRRTLLSTD